MITATLYFENGIDASDLANGLQELPEAIRPTRFSEDEGKIAKANVTSNKKQFSTFLKKNPMGFFLHTENETIFDISTRSVGHAEITMYLATGLSAELALEFFRCLAKYQPVFGFGCSEDEYVHRNRYYITIGKNHIEDWVGRKLEKYIPGVYWYTLVSDKLLSQHGVRISELSSKTVSSEVLGESSLHVLKFYVEPEAWQENTERLDNLCERVDGVFSIRSLESAVEGVSDYMEYDEIIADWR